MSDLLKDDHAIIQGGVYLMVAVLLAMVTYLVFLPLLAVLPPLLADMNTHATTRFSGMVGHCDTSITLFNLLPIISIGIAAIFFIMRAIKKQGYSEYDR